MQILTLEILDDRALKALQDLQDKRFIKILSQPDRRSLALPGKPLTPEEFKSMITEAENSGSMSIEQAKKKWAKKRKQLLKPAKKLNLRF